MQVVVGSTNPVKIAGTRKAFAKVFGDCQVSGVDVSSGVSDMPLDFDELVTGAKNRATRAIARLKADYGVGLEGGFHSTDYGTFLIGLAAIVNRRGQLGLSISGGFLVPDAIVAQVKTGKELGEVMDKIRGLKNTKQHEGAVGFFTNNLIPRVEKFESAVILALSRFIREEMYSD
jgi:inosine/xanthosine triphosphatase